MSRDAMNRSCTFLLWLWLGVSCFAQTITPEELAARIAAAQTGAERAALLTAGSGLATPALAGALVSEADKLRNKGEYKPALSLYQFTQGVAERAGDNASAAMAIDRIGNLYYRRDDYPQALKFLEQGLAMRQQLGDKKAIAETMDNIAKVYQWQENYSRAQEVYAQALTLSEEAGDRRGIARTLHNAGSAFQDQGELSRAADYFGRSLKIKEEIADREGAAITINSLGGLAYYRNDYVEAAGHYERAAAIFKELGQTPRESQVRANLAATQIDLGNYDIALDLLQQSLTVSESVGNRYVVITTLNHIGNIYFYRGDTARALEYYQKALAEAEAIKRKLSIGIALNNIAGVYDRQGDYELALDYYQKALPQRAAAEDKEGVADALNLIGRIYLALGDHKQALIHHQRSLASYEELKNKIGIAGVALSLGDLYRAQHDLPAAITQYDHALNLYEEAGIKRDAVTALNKLAETYLLQGNGTQALAHAERSIALIRQLGVLVGLPSAHTTAGRALRVMKEPQRAEQSFIEAIKAIEALREFVAGDERQQQLFFADLVAPYYDLVELFVAQGRLAEALKVAERAKGRVLLDVLGASRADANKFVTNAEQAQERKLANELTSLNAQLVRERQFEKPDPQRIAALEASLPKARREYEAFENSLYAAHPELKLKLGETRALDLAQASELLPDTHCALLEYVVSDDRAYLFVLTKLGLPGLPGSNAGSNAELKAYPLAVTRKELTEKVESFRRALAERDLEFSKPARALYDLLVAPARAQLQNKTNLMIVPDGALWELPFQALQSAPNRFLLEQSALSYSPSLSVLYEIEAHQRKRAEEKKTGGATLLAFGNPALGNVTVAHAKSVLRSGAALEPLPEAENEVKALAQLYGAQHSRVYTGAEAGERRAKEEAGRFTVVHFATHGVFNDASPMYSHLMLAGGGDDEDGLLEAWEIMKLNLRADLVVLSACETARGRVGAGEGLIGLSWAMFVAGSPTTVVSQWKVASGATRQLMVEFHRLLKAGPATRRAGGTKAEALRAASLQMMRSGEFHHPFYWASFVVIGSYK